MTQPVDEQGFGLLNIRIHPLIQALLKWFAQSKREIAAQTNGQLNVAMNASVIIGLLPGSLRSFSPFAWLWEPNKIQP